jgi:hypothetical protein
MGFLWIAAAAVDSDRYACCGQLGALVRNALWVVHCKDFLATGGQAATPRAVTHAHLSCCVYPAALQATWRRHSSTTALA